MATLDDAVAYLRDAEPGRQPLELFKEISRIATLPTLEIILLRKNPETGKVETLLTKRAADDPWWPNMWHNPGTVLLASDQIDSPHDYSDPEKRVFQGELQDSVTVVSGPHEIDVERRRVKRGDEIAIISWAEVSGEPAVGQYFALDELPADVMQHQIPSYHAAAAELEKQ